MTNATAVADATAYLLPPAGPQAQGWTGKCKSSTVGVGLGWVFILSPSARTGPSRLGPAGEGRSDGGVLHLHPRGQARHPEGGRRREDEPPGEGWRVRANAGDDEHQGEEDLENSPAHPGLPPRTPRRMGCRPRCFNPSLPTRHAAGSSLHQRGEPAPYGWRAISVPLALVMGGLSRSVAEPFQARPGRYEARTVQLPKLMVRIRYHYQSGQQVAVALCRSSGLRAIAVTSLRAYAVPSRGRTLM